MVLVFICCQCVLYDDWHQKSAFCVIVCVYIVLSPYEAIVL